MRGYFNNLILWFLFGLFLNLKLSAISCLLNQIMFLDAFCSVKVDQRDAAAQLVLSSHLQLQKEGFLSTWTNSFVGPWDPSQGLHNPGKIDFNSLWLTVKSNIASSLLMQLYMKFTDEKIKLWLFIPGRHSSVVEKAKTAVCHLRGILSRSKYGLGLYSFFLFYRVPSFSLLILLHMNCFIGDEQLQPIFWRYTLLHGLPHLPFTFTAIYWSWEVSVILNCLYFVVVVLASGLWLAPGDSEEVAAALSQALRNCIERLHLCCCETSNLTRRKKILVNLTVCYFIDRALIGLSYMRFGDVFSRYDPSSQGEELFRFVFVWCSIYDGTFML